jgi:hypothetical protein
MEPSSSAWRVAMSVNEPPSIEATMNLPALYAKYMKPEALTDEELKFFHAKLSKLVELLFEMGFTLEDPMFNRINQALKDAHHMKVSRLDKKGKKK